MFKDSTIGNNLATSLEFYIDNKLSKEEQGYFDINNISGQYGNLSILQKIKHPKYTDGRVWASRRKNWNWDNSYGVNISGVWVNNVLMTSGYRINYRDGYVLFDSPITSGNIRINYTFKYVEVKNYNETNFFRTDYDSFDISDSQFTTGSGLAKLDNRTQLPCISIEVLDSRAKPFEIGSANRLQYNDIVVHVLTEDSYTNTKIRDILQTIEFKNVKIFDLEKSKSSGVYPLSKDGFLVNPTGVYGYLSSNFPFQSDQRSNSFCNKVVNEGSHELDNSLYQGSVKMTFETILSV